MEVRDPLEETINEIQLDLPTILTTDEDRNDFKRLDKFFDVEKKQVL